MENANKFDWNAGFAGVLGVLGSIFAKNNSSGADYNERWQQNQMLEQQKQMINMIMWVIVAVVVVVVVVLLLNMFKNDNKNRR